MFFSTVLSLGLIAPLVSAAIIDVQVGGADGTLAYSPESISAMPGDQVVFHFQQKNHTATQSSFASPCGPLAGGFNSGFNPVAANVTDNFPTHTITVEDMNPIWVYCAQGANTAASHCGQGMVFAVNCGEDGSANSFTNFKNAALAIGAQLKAEASSTASAVATSTAVASGTTDVVSPTGTASAAATTHTVVVGGGGALAYSPSEVTAAVNDVVVFQFAAKNHTVTQSAFATPCEKLQFTSTTGQVGFDSGFMPVAANATEFPTFSIVVNDTNPIWAYCRQDNPESHCGQGMVFAVNAVDNGPKNFTAFTALAKQLNGTTTNSSTGTSSSSAASSSATGTSGTTSGASRVSTSAGLGLALVGAVFVLFL